jgi:ribosomal protein S18 acetylase RimI-like enzyme
MAMFFLPALVIGSLHGVNYHHARASDAHAAVSFYVEARWGAKHAEELAAWMGEEKMAVRLADAAQQRFRVSTKGGQGLTALQREMLVKQSFEEMNERFFSATERLPATLLLASEGSTGNIIGCVGVEAAIVDRKRSLVLRRSRTPLLNELQPDGSLPDGMEKRATLACHAVDPRKRRKGLGTELFRRAADIAAQWRLGPLVLMVEENDDTALSFYIDALGCERVFRDAGATAVVPDWPSMDYSREVLEVRRVPSPMLGLQWNDNGAEQAPTLEQPLVHPTPPAGFTWGLTL